MNEIQFSETLESISFEELKNSKHSVMQKMINVFWHSWHSSPPVYMHEKLTNVTVVLMHYIIQAVEYVLSGFFRLHSCLCLMFFQCLIEYIREGKHLITTIGTFLFLQFWYIQSNILNILGKQQFQKNNYQNIILKVYRK